MKKSRNGFWSQSFFLTSAFAASGIIALTSGCASGGFKLTRQYASWLNSQTLILRIVLYLVTGVVFAVTMLVDLVVNNTLDFWGGRVSQGTYQFKDAEKSYVARHEILPGSNLKRSTIEISDLKGRHLQTVVLQQTIKNEIELKVDGVVRTRVNHITDVPVASIFDAQGVFEANVAVLAPTVSPILAAH